MGAEHNYEVEARLIKQFQDGRNEAFDELLEAYSSDLIAIAHAGEFYYLCLSSEEARSAAYYGFYEGCRRFDTSTGRPLMAYCRHWVKKAIREYNGRPKSIDASIAEDKEEPDKSGIPRADRQSLQVWQERRARDQYVIDQFLKLLPKNHRPVVSDVLSPDGFAPQGLDVLLRKYNLGAREFDRIISEACTIFRNNRRRKVSRCVMPSSVPVWAWR